MGNCSGESSKTAVLPAEVDAAGDTTMEAQTAPALVPAFAAVEVSN